MFHTFFYKTYGPFLRRNYNNDKIGSHKITLFKSGFQSYNVYKIQCRRLVGKPRTIEKIEFYNKELIHCIPIYSLLLRYIQL